jgi:ABC-type antimicrobial peptide transport system permease subunit
MLTLVMVSGGMLAALADKAREYYGGDLQFMSGSDNNFSLSPDLTAKLQKYLPDDVKIFERFDYDGRTSELYFNGESSRLKIIKGVDFAAEKPLFSKFTFSEGSAAVVVPAGITGRNGIIISKPIAAKLGVHAGDTVTLYLRTIHGSNNVITLFVSGIFQDSSLFGRYTSYMDIQALRTVTGYASDYVNRLSFYYPGAGPSVRAVKVLQKNLEKEFNMFPLPENKYSYFAHMNDPQYKKPLYALVTLDANRSELKMMVSALTGIIRLVTILLVTIIAVGIGSTYRVIVLRRSDETGTFRAIGMKVSGVIMLFVTEAFLLLAGSFFLGTIASFIITKIVSFFNLSFIPAFDLFLTAGHLVSLFSFINFAELAAVVFAVTLGAVLITIKTLGRENPAYAISAAE